MGRHSWTVDVQSAYLEALTAGPGFTAVAKAATLTALWREDADGHKGRMASPPIREVTICAS